VLLLRIADQTKGMERRRIYVAQSCFRNSTNTWEKVGLVVPTPRLRQEDKRETPKPAGSPRARRGCLVE
jgi:hypothetical protein